MALTTVADYLAEARTLLQDTQTVKRYSDNDLKGALGLALYEARRLRPDLFANGTVQEVTAATLTTTEITMDRQYRVALVYYMVGHAMLRDEEESIQQIARAYKQTFGAQLVSLSV